MATTTTTTRTITARYWSTCPVCGTSIQPGTLVQWTKGRPAVHAACATPGTKGAPPRDSGSIYTRFSSGAEVYVNRRGRCEDAPCCGCCS